MTALQCPARVFVARPGGAPGLAAALRAERIARVWCGPLPAAVATAEAAAALLGVGVVVRGGLRGLRVEGRLPAVLEEIADEHPGEAVLVVGDVCTLPGTGAGCLELEVDADGWRVVRRGAADD